MADQTSDAVPDRILNYATPAPRELSPFARSCLKPVGWPFFCAVAVAAIIVLCSAAAPGAWFFVTLIGLLVWLIVGLYWGIRVVMLFGMTWYYRPATSPGSRWWLRWLIAPAAFLAVWGLCALDIPLYIAFFISRPAMNNVARQVATSPAAPPQRNWIGLYPVEKIEAVPSGMRFIVRGTGFLDRAGFAWSPNGTPTVIGEDHYKHLAGPWYAWRESW